jgi:hypothetical protein
MVYRFFEVVLCMFLTVQLQAQVRRSIEEDKPILIDGVELGYLITEEDSRSAGREEYARFRISFYANNGACVRTFRLRDNTAGMGSSTVPDNTVATFFVRNANGRRMTSRESRLLAREWWIPVRLRERSPEGREVTVVREMMAGHIFREGDHLENSIIVLVPLGERPKVDVILNRASDL